HHCHEYGANLARASNARDAETEPLAERGRYSPPGRNPGLLWIPVAAIRCCGGGRSSIGWNPRRASRHRGFLSLSISSRRLLCDDARSSFGQWRVSPERVLGTLGVCVVDSVGAADAACALSHVRDESSFTATTAQACGPNDA